MKLAIITVVLLLLLTVGIAPMLSNQVNAQSNDSDDDEVAFMCRETATKMLGKSHERVIEVLEYLEDHAQGLGMPEWYENPIIMCAIANKLVDMEKAQGTTFEGEELNGNLAMLIMQNMGNAANRMLENPGMYN